MFLEQFGNPDLLPPSGNLLPQGHRSPPPAFLPCKPNEYEAKNVRPRAVGIGCQMLTTGLPQVIARFTEQLVLAVRV